MPMMLLPLVPAAFQPVDAPSPPQPSTGVYRLPYGDGTQLKVFDDTRTHRPRARIDRSPLVARSLIASLLLRPGG